MVLHLYYCYFYHKFSKKLSAYREQKNPKKKFAQPSHELTGKSPSSWQERDKTRGVLWFQVPDSRSGLKKEYLRQCEEVMEGRANIPRKT